MLQPTASSLTLLAQTLLTYLALARRHEAGILADLTPESLHDYRVALRKMRSAVALLRHVLAPETTTALKAQLAALMHTTNRLRDLDVYLLAENRYRQVVDPTLQQGLDPLFNDFRRERQQQWQQFTALLNTPHYQQSLADIAQQFHDPEQIPTAERAGWPARAYAARLIQKRYRRIVRAASALTATTSEEELHRLRIECKKLRYLLEFSRPLWDLTLANTLMSTLKTVQDTLGLFNDYAVQQQSLWHYRNTLLHPANPTLTPEIHPTVIALDQLLTYLAQQQQQVRQPLEPLLHHFCSTEIQTQFQNLLGTPATQSP